MSTTNTPASAKQLDHQSNANKVWDAVLKINVALACVLLTMVLSHETRITRNEASASQNTKAIDKLDGELAAVGGQLVQRLDRIIASLELLGNRITRLETKLETR